MQAVIGVYVDTAEHCQVLQEVGDEVVNSLSNPYLVALGIPFILIMCGALGKKLVRGTEWIRSDFFLGVELSLSAMASALVYIFDLAKLTVAGATPLLPLSHRITATTFFVALSFFLLLLLLSTHQDWEKRTQNPKGQFLWLVLISDVIGAGLLATFVLYVKGV